MEWFWKERAGCLNHPRCASYRGFNMGEHNFAFQIQPNLATSRIFILPSCSHSFHAKYRHRGNQYTSTAAGTPLPAGKAQTWKLPSVRFHRNEEVEYRCSREKAASNAFMAHSLKLQIGRSITTSLVQSCLRKFVILHSYIFLPYQIASRKIFTFAHPIEFSLEKEINKMKALDKVPCFNCYWRAPHYPGVVAFAD